MSSNSRSGPSVEQGSPDRFGYSWSHFNELSPHQEEQFKRWTCFLDPARDWVGRTFIDVGCGGGRNSYWPMTYGAKGGLAIDADERSIAVARNTLKNYSTVEVRSRSVYDLDIEDGFDIAFAIGVIHHLEDPQLALVKMKNAVKPRGQVLIWVYGYENAKFFSNVLNPLRRVLFSRMPLGFVRYLAFAPAAVLWLLLRAGFGGIEYFDLIRGFPFLHLHHIVFDQMIPRVSNYWRREEVLALMEGAGLSDVRIEPVNDISWAAIGLKSADAPARESA